MQRLRGYGPMLRSRLFWSALGIIFLLAMADDLLDKASITTDLYLIPISLLWLPVMLVTINFGVSGSLAVSSWLILINLQNWLLHVGVSDFEHIAIELAVVLTSLFVGLQVDQKMAAQRRAGASAYAVRNQEEELRRLSLDIHDETLQTLMASCHRLDVIRNSSPLDADLREIRNDIERVAKELRDLTGNLRPFVLEDLGIVPAIRQLLVGLAGRTGITKELEVTGEEYRLPPDVETQVFRIVQESLRNVERHAMAKRVTVAVAFTNKEITLLIADDGIGFDTSQLRNTSGATHHYGIMGMMERAELIHGRIRIESDVRRGTRITAHIPGPKSVSVPVY